MLVGPICSYSISLRIQGISKECLGIFKCGWVDGVYYEGKTQVP